MRILVDAFGGDNAPLAILEGCRMAKEKYPVDIILVGHQEKIEDVCEANEIFFDHEVIHAPDVITMEDHPNAIRNSKKDSSVAVALRALSDGQGDGLVSAGSTGALLFGATTLVGRIKGVKRPALAPCMPKSEGMFMLIDSGANADCRPEMLAQFGQMGAIYMEKVMGIKNPRVGLANVGTEDTKGDELRKAAFPMLKESGLNFVGNIEARDIPYDACDIVVADGFTGNIILKMYEGVAGALLGKIKGVMTASFKNKIAAAILLKDMKAMKKQLDYREVGGAPFLGVQKPVFKAHGSSDAKAFCNAIGSLSKYIEAGVVDTIAESIK